MDGTSETVQCLGLHTFTAGGTGQIPGRATKIHMLLNMAKKKKKEEVGGKIVRYRGSHLKEVGPDDQGWNYVTNKIKHDSISL